ncbi:Lactonohydrolase [Lasiodiplodia theobromae]|uniref:Lactonohydrolase n=1 Tax=Lasiodiplodia theobromae TaxID=45133 RepID=UPI0015C3DB68|nr:Lactonohydrolase [Lasiodiplodia theobromae]KAF4540624.1 Lactonohydrolase [Lasiodiplodia theobromae]
MRPLAVPLLASAALLAASQQVPLELDESPLAAPCSGGYSFPAIVCIRNRGAVIRGDWERPVTNDLAHADTFRSTNMPHEPSFRHVQDADFVVWDESRGSHVLGPAPAVDFVFTTKGLLSHEAPVYSPETNELYFARLEHRFLAQLAVDLNADPPVLREKTANPPIYGATGARYRKGLIYFSTLGGDDFGGHSYRPGIYTLNATSGESRALLNNYYGYYFNGADDFDIDADGHIWFTDNDYGRAVRLNAAAPQLNPATYRFDPATGLVTVVEDTLREPNGAQFSPDGRTLYLTDTGAGETVIDAAVSPAPPIQYNSTGKRSIYAYDVDPVRKVLGNKRPFYQSMQMVPDGIKVSEDGQALKHFLTMTAVTPNERTRLLESQSYVADPLTLVGKEDPKAWHTEKKWAVAIVVSCYGLIIPATAAMVVPAFTQISHDLNISGDGEVQLVMSVFLLGWGIGPILVAPLSEVYGRRLLLNTGHTLFLITNTLCGCVSNKSHFMFLRFISGLCGSGPMSIGAGVLSDLWHKEERGLSLSIYALGPLAGPAIGPIAAGYIVEKLSWRWIFFSASTFAFIMLVLGYFLLLETFPPVLLRWKKQHLRAKGFFIGEDDEVEEAKGKTLSSLKGELKRPFVMLGTQPIIQTVALLMGFLFGLNQLTIATFETLWEERYGMPPRKASLNYAFIAAGLTFGSQVGGRINDKIYARLKRRNNQTGRPEFRAPLMLAVALLLPVGQLLYGWSAQFRLYFLLPNLGVTLFSTGIIVGYQCIQAYVIDCYPVYAASAMGSLTLLRSAGGFVFPEVAPALYRALGYGWASTLIAGVAGVVGVAAPVVLWVWGPGLRARSPYASGEVGL